jgi:hypothetical protein
MTEKQPEGLPETPPAAIEQDDIYTILDALQATICAWDCRGDFVRTAKDVQHLARLAEALAIVARAYDAAQQRLRAVPRDDQSVTNEHRPGQRRPKEARARLSALIPRLSEHDAELLLRVAERLLTKPDISPATDAAGPRVAPPEQGTPASPASAHLVRMLSDPTVRAILENLAPYSEDVRAALRVARALDRARSRQEAGDTALPPVAS